MDKKNSQSTRLYIEGELEAPISDVYPVIDNDLARDNIENALSPNDLLDL